MRTLVPEASMILTLTVQCVGGTYLEDQCVRVIEIDEDASLYDLHNIIQDSVRFGNDHPFEFFIANSGSWGANRRWLTEKEEWEEKEEDFWNITLRSIYPLGGRKKLYYLFDFGDQWTFEIRKGRGVKTPETDVSYPRIVQAIGPNPRQYPRFE